MIAQPQSIGPYSILQSIGQGGMGVVFRAEHRATGARVAIKTVRVAHQRVLASIRREIHALSRVQHPGVVRILDHGVDGARPWYAMELLEGISLEQYLRDVWEAAAVAGARSRVGSAQMDTLISLERPPAGPASDVASVGRQRTLRPPAAETALACGGRVPEVLALFQHLCEALAHIHGEGIVHRDLKPGNVLVRPDGSPVLVDFGLVSRSRGARGREVLDAEGRSLAGTPEYMAPEQILGELTDARTDLYALGCMLYEAATGTLPFQGTSAPQIFEQQLFGEPEPPSRRVAGLPEGFDALALKLLAKRARERPGHADDVAHALESMGAARTPVSPSRRAPARAYLYRAELQGRDELLERFRAWMGEARGARGRCVVLGGDSGAGKTYLAMEVVRAAHERGFRVVASECVPPDSAGSNRAGMGAPLSCFARLLQAVADRCAEEGPEATRRLLGARGPVLAEVEPALGQLPGLEDLPAPAALPPQAAQDRLLAALAETLAAFAEEEPVLLTVDDAQWADELSLRFLTMNLPREIDAGRRVLTLVIHRSDEGVERLAPLLAHPSVERVALSGLARGDVGAVVGSMLALPDPPAGFVEFLARRSAGNPFFVAEYLRAAVDAGVVRRDDAGRWLFTARDDRPSLYEELGLPDSLHALVERRLDALSPDATRACRAAAALGGGFDAALLAAASGLGESQCLEAARELLERGVLDEGEPGTFRFVQGRYREIMYERVPRGELPALHRAAGEALAARFDGAPSASGLSAPYPELAHHFRVAGDAARAVGYLERAGEQALRASANREAVRYLSDAVALADERSVPVEQFRRARWERYIGEALLGLGEVLPSRAHLERALGLLGAARPSGNGALARDMLVQVARQVRTRVSGPRGVGRLAPSEALEAARAYDQLNQGFFHAGEPLPILHATLAVLNLTEFVGPTPELVVAYANAHGAAALAALHGLADTYARGAERALARAPDPVAESWLRFMTGMSALSSARWPLAEERLGRAMALAEALGFRRRWEEATGTLAGMHYLRGEFDRSLALVERYAASVQRGDAQGRVWALQGLAQHMVRRCEFERAEATMREAEKLAAGDPNAAGGLAGGFVVLHRAAGRRGQALEAAARAAAAYAKRPPLAYYEVHALDAVALTRVEAFAAAPDRAARKLVEQSLAALSSYARSFAIARPVLALRRAQFRTAADGPGKARGLWEKARNEASALAMPYHGALVDRFEAATLPGADPRRAELLARARSVFERCGAGADLREMEALGAGRPTP